jgi:hypothetical protein
MLKFIGLEKVELSSNNIYGNIQNIQNLVFSSNSVQKIPKGLSDDSDYTSDRSYLNINTLNKSHKADNSSTKVFQAGIKEINEPKSDSYKSSPAAQPNPISTARRRKLPTPLKPASPQKKTDLIDHLELKTVSNTNHLADDTLVVVDQSKNPETIEQTAKLTRAKNPSLNKGQQPFIRPARKREANVISTSKITQNNNYQTSENQPTSNDSSNDHFFRYLFTK